MKNSKTEVHKSKCEPKFVEKQASNITIAPRIPVRQKTTSMKIFFLPLCFKHVESRTDEQYAK
jgi:hypothetical protein